MLSRLVKKLKLPAVTGYLIAGILIGPYCLGLLGNAIDVQWLGFQHIKVGENVVNTVSAYTILCDVALGFIAFAIGDEFRISSLKKIGKDAFLGCTALKYVTVKATLDDANKERIFGKDKELTANEK